MTKNEIVNLLTVALGQVTWLKASGERPQGAREARRWDNAQKSVNRNRRKAEKVVAALSAAGALQAED